MPTAQFLPGKISPGKFAIPPPRDTMVKYPRDRVNNLFILFRNLFISLIELKTLLNNLFISYSNLFISLIKLKNIH